MDRRGQDTVKSGSTKQEKYHWNPQTGERSKP